MRLLKCDQQGRLSLTKDITKDVPPYAILSHTWSPNDEDEVTFEDITTGADTTKIGYDKLRFCVQQAAKDGLAYSWVDTCCINKASEPELSQAIRSMFRWYRDAKRCYVYLYDVQRSTGDVGWETEFTGSHWFSRGWTLQELLAPQNLDFFSRHWARLGDKSTLRELVYKRTNIPIAALMGNIFSFGVADRLSWALGRQTKRDEDIVYSLLGLFDIHIPILYGEGQQSAMDRLKREIRLTHNSQLPCHRFQ